MARGFMPPATGATILDDLMSAYTQTIPIFIRRKMMCIGCPVNGLHDISDACREYGIALDVFLAEINAAIANPSPR